LSLSNLQILPPVIRIAVQTNGRLVGTPILIDPFQVFCSKAALDEHKTTDPVSLAQLERLAQKKPDKRKKAAPFLCAGKNDEHLIMFFSSLLEACAGSAEWEKAASMLSSCVPANSAALKPDDFTAFFARGGYLDSLRQKGSVPMNVVPGLGDHNVGMNLVAGILAALYQAKVKGVGEKVETSLFESAIFNFGMMIQASNYEGIAQNYPIDVRESANPFNAAWRTKDDRFIQTCMPDYNTYYKKTL